MPRFNEPFFLFLPSSFPEKGRFWKTRKSPKVHPAVLGVSQAILGLCQAKPSPSSLRMEVVPFRALHHWIGWCACWCGVFCGDERGGETTGEKGHGVKQFFVDLDKRVNQPMEISIWKKRSDGRGDFWGSMLNIFRGVTVGIRNSSRLSSQYRLFSHGFTVSHEDSVMER